MKRIAFIGGDRRNFELSKMNWTNMAMRAFGFYDNKDSIFNCVNCEYIVFPIPFSKDGESLYAPLSADRIYFKDIIEKVENKIVFGGKFVDKASEILSNKRNRIIDFNKEKNFVVNNTIPTAEGIVKIIIENTDITIDGSNITILGHGNVGKRAAKILCSLGANIFCYDNNKQEVANIENCGYNVLEDLNCNISKMDVIVNTVPTRIITKDMFRYINKNTLIVDIASMPGGIDYEYAKKNSYKVIHALGLPGIIAPVTSAIYMKNVIEKYIE